MNQLMTKQAKKPANAVIYLRVSTEEQVDNFSLETQEQICRKEAEKREITIIETFRDEGKSAKNIQGRPSLIQMLEYCRKHKKDIDAVIVYRLDRISRQTADYLAIRKKLIDCEITLISATEPTGNSPTEKFVETMLAGFAQMDNDVKSERSRNGLRARFLAGLNTGYVPIGYLNKNGYAVKDSKTFDKLKAAWEQMATGTTTLREMAKMLAEQGVKQKHSGGRESIVHAQTLQRMFRNKFYTGKVISKKYDQEIQGQHAPMVTEAQFYRVQAVLDGRNTNINVPLARRNPDNPDFPLRRIVKCSGCDVPLTGGWSKGHTKRYAYYFCKNWCGATPSTPVEVLETALIKRLGTISLTDKTLELLSAYLRRTYYKRLATMQKRRAEADTELQKAYTLRQGLIEKNIQGIYSDDVYKEQNKMLEEKIRTLQLSKDDALIEKYNLENITTFMHRYFKDLSRTYVDSDLNQKRVLLSSIYPLGLAWSKRTYLNSKNSPFYRAVLDLQGDSVSFGAGERT